MDLHWVVTGLLGIVVSGIGWFAQTLWRAHEDMRKEHALLQVQIAKEYVPNSRLEDILRDIKADMRLILSKLDDKEDRK